MAKVKRIGAGTYLLSMSSVVIVWSAATLYLGKNLAASGSIGLSDLNFYVSALGSVVAIIFWPLSKGRLRDLNFPDWMVRLLALPLLGVIMLPLLCFLSGPRWTNDHGNPPQRSGILKICIALLLFGVAILASWTALSEFYRVRYMLAHPA